MPKQSASRKDAVITTRVDSQLKTEVDAILHQLGMSRTEAITVFFHQIRNTKGLPFPVRIPNQTTLDAIDELEQGQGTPYTSLDELIKPLKPPIL